MDEERVTYPDEVEAAKKEAAAQKNSGPDAVVEGPADVQQVELVNRNFIQTPGNCPPGFKMGADGKCREVFD